MAAATTVKANDAPTRWSSAARDSSNADVRPPCATGCSTRACRRSAGARRRRVGARAAGRRRSARLGQFSVGDACAVHRLPRLAQLPAAHDRPGAGPSQAGRQSRSADASSRRRRRRTNTVTPRDLPIGAMCSVRPTPDAARPSRARPTRRGRVDRPLRVRRRRPRRDAHPVAASSSWSRAGSGPARARSCGRCWAWHGRPSSASRWREVFAGTAGTRRSAAFLVPPNAAFLPQVPQLMSDSLADQHGLR
jgi:hypothetical protein